MNKFIINQINNSRDILIYSKKGKISQIIDEDELLIKSIYNVKNNIELTTRSNYIFYFSSNKNESVRLPLLIMEGTIEDTDKDYVYLKCNGFKLESKKCISCTKFGDYSPICDQCRTKFGEVFNIKWEGWLPKNRILVYEEK